MAALAEIRTVILYRLYSDVATDAVVVRKSKSALLDVAAIMDRKSTRGCGPIVKCTRFEFAYDPDFQVVMY